MTGRSVSGRQKVLIVGAFPPPGKRIFGGIVRICRTLLESSFADEFDVILVDSTQISNPPPRLHVRLFLAIARFARYLGILFRTRPDAVIVLCSGFASVLEKGAMGWCARALGIPVLVFPRHAGVIDIARTSHLKGKMIGWSFSAADRFLCQGAKWQEFAMTDLGFRQDHAPIIPNWTATPELLEIGQRRDQAMLRPITEILFVGWLEREKGVEELLQAVNTLRNRGLRFHLTIAGRGHAEAASRAYVEAEDLSGHVSFVGWIEGSALLDLYRNADVFVLPSWKEGLPNAMIEAMAAGLAIVVTPVGNIPHYVAHEQEALLIERGSTRAIESALEVMIEDKAKRRWLAQNGHHLAAQKFAVGPAMHSLTAVVKDAISGGSSD